MTDHKDLIARLAWPVDPSAPEDEVNLPAWVLELCAEARDALEAAQKRYNDVISERPYIVGWNDGFGYCESGDETKDVPDVVSALVSRQISDVWAEATAASWEVALEAIQDAPAGYSCHIVEHLTPQSARDWLEKREAEVYRKAQEVMRERAAMVCREAVFDDPIDSTERFRNRALTGCEVKIRALPIKEKDNE